MNTSFFRFSREPNAATRHWFPDTAKINAEITLCKGKDHTAAMVHSRRNSKESEVIDENLKRVYQDMLEEQVPDRFLDLIAQLRAQDETGGTGGDDTGEASA
ncbi:NepR family anti-sigma factor [Alloyangia pacifica]|uniref:NepR family anti-sigma factor n=1 Tax=Alloyangia pacifica TaxID=311180 RepID=UPI00299E81E9|nr:NepR family anti-sigma factor [Alloyangia pacifica]